MWSKGLNQNAGISPIHPSTRPPNHPTQPTHPPTHPPTHAPTYPPTYPPGLRIATDWLLLTDYGPANLQQPRLTMWISGDVVRLDCLLQLRQGPILGDACVLLDDMKERKGEIRKARDREMRKLRRGGYEMCPALLVTSVLSE